MDDSDKILEFLFDNFTTKIGIPFKTIKDVIEGLHEFLTINGYDEETYSFMLRWKYQIGILKEEYRTISFGKNSIVGLIDEIRNYIKRTLPAYSASEELSIDSSEEILLNTEIIIPKVYIYERNYGYGPGETLYEYYQNTLYKFIYPNSKTNCIINCIALDEKKSPQTISREFDKYREKYGHNLTNKEISEDLYNINYLTNKQPYDETKINICIKGNHVGLVLPIDKEIEVKDDNETFTNKINCKRKKDIIIAAVDFEFSWEEQQDGTKKAMEPTLGVLVWKENNIYRKYIAVQVKKTHQEVTKQIISQLLILNEEGKEIFCYSANGRAVEHLIIVRNLLDTNKGFNQFYKNTEGTKIKSFNLKNITFIDAQLLFPGSLNNFAKSMKVETKIPIEDIMIEKGYWNKEDGLFMELNKWQTGPKEKDNIEIDYCYNDSLILLKSIEQYNEYISNIFQDLHKDKLKEHIKFDISKPQDIWYLNRLSLSGIAQSILTSKHEISTTPNEFVNLILKSYIGGRTEAFRLGIYQKSKEYKILAQDINASYPHQMTKGLANNVLSVNIEPDELPAKGYWLAYVNLTHKPNVDIGRIAIRTEDSIIFPTGTFDAWIFEFEYYDRTDLEINYIHLTIEYDLLDVSKTINYIFNKRLEVGKNTAFGTTIKLLLNSIYGKFGEKPDRKQICLINDIEKFKDKFYNQLYYNSGVLQLEGLDKPDWYYINLYSRGISNVNVLAASRITSLGRLHLYDKIYNIVHSGGKPLYSDTDSIYYLHPNNLDIPTNNTELGEFDCKELKYIEIKTLKVYKYIDLEGKETIKYKGVQRPENLNSEQINKQWFRKKLNIYNKQVNKTSCFKYTKGILSSDELGTLTLPHQLEKLNEH